MRQNGVFHQLHRMDRRDGSQLARAAGAEIGASPLGKPVEPARLGIALDPLVELSGLEFLEPGRNLASSSALNSMTAISMSSTVRIIVKLSNQRSRVMSSRRYCRASGSVAPCRRRAAMAMRAGERPLRSGAGRRPAHFLRLARLSEGAGRQRADSALGCAPRATSLRALMRAPTR